MSPLSPQPCEVGVRQENRGQARKAEPASDLVSEMLCLSFSFWSLFLRILTVPALTLKDFSPFVKGLLVLGESQDVGSILGFHGLEGNTATLCPTLSGYPSIRAAGR